MLVCGNRGVKERRKVLICITSKPVRAKEVEILKGPCMQHLRHKVGMVVNATHGDKPRIGGLWASESPKFRPLYDDVNWIGDKEYEAALQLVGDRHRQGTEVWMNACRFLGDTLLQDSVAVMRLTNMDSTIPRERNRDFPFLAPAHKNYALFAEFYVESGRYYEALAAADAATLQPPPPPTPAQAAGQKRKL
ncbi:g8559 [Coccomyxa elongata]